MRIAARILLGLALLAAGPGAWGQDLAPFEPGADYEYGLDATRGRHYTVELTASGFRWPGIDGDADTAFLELPVAKARRRDPAIVAAAGPARTRQTFEGRARGRRYLDLSSLLGAAAAGSEVALAGEGMSWEPGPSQLHVYRSPSLAGRRVLVVAPHPDDAEIAAFGVYSTSEADVVTVTAGDAGGRNFASIYPDDGSHYRVKGWIRTWDSISVPFYGGVPPGSARNLGFYDATLDRMWWERPAALEPPLAELEDPAFYRRLNTDPVLRDRPFRATWDGLVSDLLAELERVRPRTVVTPHPLLDRHLDHQFTTVALLEALEMWQGEYELYLYTNHAVGNEAWPFGPRGDVAGLPPWDGGELFFSRLYSHPLAAETRHRKLIALEAMHDLRPFDLRDGRLAEPGRRERERAARLDYFRRAPRPNEIFLVASEADGSRLLRAFLDQR
ncbi:MAG: PIG-L family deacetylase [Thermoanaerobaculia bacterium]|nr:PIG-L family deacetylase [Thermoanaerobaculia bacterium]